MNKTITCIVPFYNERSRIEKVLQKLSQISEIDQIIAVDDGSSDNSSAGIKQLFPEVDVLVLEKNSGKAHAIKMALERAEGQFILMMDADYVNLEVSEIRQIINKFKQASHVDMLLVKVSGGNNALDRLLRKEVLFTGFRLLSKETLVDVLKQRILGYQLEVAINKYMLDNSKRVFWIDSSVKNVHKFTKWGFPGLINSIQMEFSILSYLGLRNLFRQIYSFSKTELS